MKNISKIILELNVILFVTLSFFCEFHSAYGYSVMFNGTKTFDTSQKKDGDILAYSTIIRDKKNKSNSLEIKTTYIYDKAYLENMFVADSNMVVISQELIFRHNNTILATKSHNVKKNIVVRNGEKVALLENVIVEVGIMYGKKGSFYAIEGSGLCNSCSVYSGYFSLTGKELYKEYSTYENTKISKTGNFDRVMNTYGIVKSQWLGRFTNTWVFPPQRSGENIK